MRLLHWFLFYIAMMFVVVGMLMLVWPVYAHDESMARTPEEARVYRFYISWMRPPERKYSCCDMRDCHNVEIKRENGKWWYLDNVFQHAWREIPEDRLEHNASDARESPDGRNHVCFNSVFTLCAVLGSGQ